MALLSHITYPLPTCWVPPPPSPQFGPLSPPETQNIIAPPSFCRPGNTTVRPIDSYPEVFDFCSSSIIQNQVISGNLQPTAAVSMPTPEAFKTRNPLINAQIPLFSLPLQTNDDKTETRHADIDNVNLISAFHSLSTRANKILDQDFNQPKHSFQLGNKSGMEIPLMSNEPLSKVSEYEKLALNTNKTELEKLKGHYNTNHTDSPSKYLKRNISPKAASNQTTPKRKPISFSVESIIGR